METSFSSEWVKGICYKNVETGEILYTTFEPVLLDEVDTVLKLQKSDVDQNMEDAEGYADDQIPNFDLTAAQTTSSSSSSIKSKEDKRSVDDTKYIQVVDLRALEVHKKIKELLKLAFGIRKNAKRNYGYQVPYQDKSYQIFDFEFQRNCLRKGDTFKCKEKTSEKITSALLVLDRAFQRDRKTEKRNIYYNRKDLYKDASQVDPIINNICLLIGCTRNSLNIISSAKGRIIGHLSIKQNGELIDCMNPRCTIGEEISPDVKAITIVSSDANFILVVEKEATYFNLCEEEFHKNENIKCIIITAKGVQDVATRYLLKNLKDRFDIPVLGLVDFDPYGLSILCNYRYGSKSMSYDSLNMATKDIKWFGVTSQDLEKYGMLQTCLLKMNKDYSDFLKSLLLEPCVSQNPHWFNELTRMKNLDGTVGIEVFDETPGLIGRYMLDKWGTGKDWQ